MRSRNHSSQSSRVTRCASRTSVPASRTKAQQRYAKWALLRIVRHRVFNFEQRFGREPGVHEPLFFDDGAPVPVQADPNEVKRQIRQAARAEGVDAEKVLAYLGL
jgi:hypothetical protein